MGTICLMSLEWSKSTVFQTVNKNHLHAAHALFQRTDFKSVTISNLPALAGSGLVQTTSRQNVFNASPQKQKSKKYIKFS